MRNPVEMLEELISILEDLRERPDDAVILVEGQKDKDALIELGVGGEVWQIKGGNSIFNIAEELAHNGKSAIILTDWDRKGGQLCRALRIALTANGVPFDDSIRMRLVQIAKKEVKDIEGLPTLYLKLMAETRR
jgi:dTMP kinase